MYVFCPRYLINTLTNTSMLTSMTKRQYSSRRPFVPQMLGIHKALMCTCIPKQVHVHNKTHLPNLVSEYLTNVYSLFVWTLEHILCAALRDSECFEIHEFHNLCKTLLLIDNQHDILACMKGQYEKKNIYIYIYVYIQYIYTLVYTHTIISLSISFCRVGGERMQRVQE